MKQKDDNAPTKNEVSLPKWVLNQVCGEKHHHRPFIKPAIIVSNHARDTFARQMRLHDYCPVGRALRIRAAVRGKCNRVERRSELRISCIDAHHANHEDGG